MRDGGTARLRIGGSRSVIVSAAGFATIGATCCVWMVAAPSPAVCLLFGLLTMACVNYLVSGRDVLYPSFIYCAIWSFVAGIYYFCPIPINHIGWKTVGILLAGAASFSIGSWLGNRPLIYRSQTDPHPLQTETVQGNPQARHVLLVLAVLATLLFLINVIRLAGGIFNITPLFLLELNSSDSPLERAGTITNLVIGSGGLLPVLALWVMIMEERRRWKIVVCGICVCLFPLFVTQRGLLMVAICGAITLFLLKTANRSFSRTAKPLGLAALGILVVMGSLSLTKSWAQNPGGYSVMDGVWMYVAGPIATFDYAIYHPEAFRDQPAAVFAQVLTPLSELNLIRYQTFQAKEGSKLDKFVFVPFPGNVYTAYKPYYEDFGLTGCLIAFGSFGLIEGYLFFRAVRGNRYAIFCFAYLAGALMFTTFDDMYHAFSRHLNILVFVLGYFWLMKRKRVRL